MRTIIEATEDGIVDDDVRALGNRIAAAMIRQDFGFVEDVLMGAKAVWRKEGRDAEVEANKRRADYEMCWHRKRRYWFQTLDGLLGEHEIDAEMSHHEMIVLAARHPMELKLDDDYELERAKSIPIRRYLWTGKRHRDGRPIFEEQP